MERKFHNETTNVWCLTSSYFGGEKSAEENEFRSQMCLAISKKNDYMLIYGAKKQEFIDYCVQKYKITTIKILFLIPKMICKLQKKNETFKFT